MLVPVIAVLLATGMGATAVLGGLDRVPDPPPAALGPGDTLDQGQFATRFLGTKFVAVPPANRFSEEKRFIDLMFKVTNLGAKTVPVGSPSPPGRRSSFFSFFGGSVLRTEPEIKSGSGGTGLVLTRGGVESRQLHPGVPATVVVRYELDEDARVPGTLVLHMGSFEMQERFPSKVAEWSSVMEEAGDKRYAPVVVAKVTLPVQRGEA
ncbi:hypothetical protein DP939_04475 [Spongiactinospora rosea]|uniref:Uncharacterized protein n=1 Tax=Spongiactinospora rosea TaxID=2248750 RepID=A0A366M8Y7_9ACTN|nr:hypothetical protein DP939_04475 [Spongiactinospora rosea]